MKTIGLVLVGLIAVLGGLIAYDKHQKQKNAEAYELLLREQQAARKKVADAHRGAAMAKLAIIATAIAGAKAAPPVTSTVPLAVDLMWPATLTHMEYGAVGNTAVAGIAQPQEVSRPLVARFAPRAQQYLGPMSDTPSFDSTHPEEIEKMFAQLEALNFALLVRVHAVTLPSSDAGGRFVGGTAKGDAALYELATGRRLGAYPFSVTQRDTAKVSKQDSVDAQLLEAFTYDVKSGVDREFAAFVAGKAGLAAPGVAAAADLERFARKIEMETGLPYAAANIIKVEVKPGAAGKPSVSVYAESPKLLLPGGKVSTSLAESITKILGTEAEIHIEQAPPKIGK